MIFLLAFAFSVLSDLVTFIFRQFQEGLSFSVFKYIIFICNSHTLLTFDEVGTLDPFSKVGLPDTSRPMGNKNNKILGEIVTYFEQFVAPILSYLIP